MLEQEKQLHCEKSRMTVCKDLVARGIILDLQRERRKKRGLLLW